MKHTQFFILALLCTISTAVFAQKRPGVDKITLISNQPFDRAVAKVNFIPHSGKPHHGYVEISPVSGRATGSAANLLNATTGICKYVISPNGYQVKTGSCGAKLLKKYNMDADNIKAIQIAEIRIGRFADQYFGQGISGTKRRPYGGFARSNNNMKGTTARTFKVEGHRIVIVGKNK